MNSKKPGVALVARTLSLIAITAAFANPAFADTGDTAWMLTSTALVLFMTLPGLALFYGGLVQGKNLLSVLMQCLVLACLMSLVWVAIGYSIAFGNDGGSASVWGFDIDEQPRKGVFIFSFSMSPVVQSDCIVARRCKCFKFSLPILFGVP